MQGTFVNQQTFGQQDFQQEGLQEMSNRLSKAALEANQQAIKQQFIQNWNFSNYNDNVTVPPVPPDYEYKIQAYPAVSYASKSFVVSIPIEDAPKSEKLERLSYKDFCEIAAAVVKEFAPGIKIVTDCSAASNMIWLECHGAKREACFFAGRPEASIRPEIVAMCRQIQDELGKNAVR